MSDQPIQENGTPIGPRGVEADRASAVQPGPLRCARCDATWPAGTSRCGTCQTFLAGNQAARVSGAYARQHPPDLRMTADELVAGIVADLGGEAELSTIEKLYARKLGDTEILCRALASDLSRNGLMTSKRGQGAAFVRRPHDGNCHLRPPGPEARPEAPAKGRAQPCRLLASQADRGARCVRPRTSSSSSRTRICPT